MTKSLFTLIKVTTYDANREYYNDAECLGIYSDEQSAIDALQKISKKFADIYIVDQSDDHLYIEKPYDYYEYFIDQSELKN